MPDPECPGPEGDEGAGDLRDGLGGGAELWRLDGEGASLIRSVAGVGGARQVVFAGPHSDLHVATGPGLRRIRYRVEEVEAEACPRLGRGLAEEEIRTNFATGDPFDPCRVTREQPGTAAEATR